MSGITAVSPSTAIQLIRPVRGASASGHSSNREYATLGGTAVAAAYADTARAARAAVMGAYAPFVVQAIANDNVDVEPVSQIQGTIAYIIARDRVADLPVGFLVARAV